MPGLDVTHVEAALVPPAAWHRKVLPLHFYLRGGLAMTTTMEVSETLERVDNVVNMLVRNL